MLTLSFVIRRALRASIPIRERGLRVEYPTAGEVVANREKLFGKGEDAESNRAATVAESE
jgi:hypothetical protein